MDKIICEKQVLEPVYEAVIEKNDHGDDVVVYKEIPQSRLINGFSFLSDSLGDQEVSPTSYSDNFMVLDYTRDSVERAVTSMDSDEHSNS